MTCVQVYAAGERTTKGRRRLGRRAGGGRGVRARLALQSVRQPREELLRFYSFDRFSCLECLVFITTAVRHEKNTHSLSSQVTEQGKGF